MKPTLLPSTFIRNAQRRGAAMLFVVVMLFVASLVMATLVQSVLRQHRQLRLERLRTQAGWCADAGLQRAIAQLQLDPAYRQETWTIDLPGQSDAATLGQAGVQIHVETVGQEHSISVVAEYPLGEVHRVRTRRTTIYHTVDETASSALEPENSQP